MSDEEKYLDDIEETGADTAEAEQAEAASEAVESGHEAEAGPDAEAAAEGGPEKAEKPNPAASPNRPAGYVPHQALVAERAARAAAEDRLTKFIERYYRDNGVDQGDKEQANEAPDPAKDPIGALEWTRQRVAQIESERQQQQQQAQQQTEAQRQWQEAYGQVQSYFARKVAEEPALQDTYQGVRQSWAREYAALNPGVPEAAIAQMVERQEAQIIQWAYRNQYPIDQVIKQLAVSRGVQAGVQQPKDPKTGQFVKSAPSKESRERNVSLTGAGGGAAKSLDPKEIAKMPEEEMWAYLDSLKGKPGYKEFEKAMGFR